jgi:hypothetical protein
MKSVINYWVYIFSPMIGLMLLGMNHLLSSTVFVLSLMIYCAIYHPLISGLRLVALGIIRKNDLLKAFIPGYYNWKYFSILFFNRE